MRRVDDVGRGAVVLLQLDDLRAGEILFEFQNVADIRAAPLVDALVVVPDDAEVAVFLRQQVDEAVLQHVRVLIFVHHDVAELVLVAQQRLFVAFEQPHRVQDEVVEVHGVVLAQSLLVAVIQRAQRLIPLHVAVLAGVFRRAHRLFLRVGDLRQHVGRRKLLLVEFQFLDDALHQGFLVHGVVYDEIAVVADLVRFHAQDAKAGGMERLDPHARAGAHKGLDAFAHFGRGLVRERDRQNAVRADPRVLDHVSDAVGHRSGLAGAGPGQDEKRPLQRGGRFVLLGIQFCEVFLHDSLYTMMLPPMNSRRMELFGM